MSKRALEALDIIKGEIPGQFSEEVEIIRAALRELLAENVRLREKADLYDESVSAAQDLPI